MRPSAWERTANGLTLRVRLTPRGGRDAIDGIEARSDGQVVLKARVAAPPEDGKANAALERFLAGVLGLPASAVTVAAGHKSRIKTLDLSGDPVQLEDALEEIVRSRA